MKIFIVVFLSVYSFSYGLSSLEFSLEPSNRYYYWREYGNNNEKLLDERGFIQGLSSTFKYLPNNDRYLEYSLSLSYYQGSIDYNGQTQVGDKFYSKTDIEGAKITLNYSIAMYTMDNSNLLIAINSGIDLERWTRYINSGSSYPEGIPSKPSSVNGYNEIFTYIQYRIGLMLQKGRGVLELGTRYPIYRKEVVELSHIGYLNDIILKPGREFSPYIHGIYSLSDRVSLMLKIDSKLLEKSNRAEAYYYGDFGKTSEVSFIQPKSLQIISSFSIGYRF